MFAAVPEECMETMAGCAETAKLHCEIKFQQAEAAAAQNVGDPLDTSEGGQLAVSQATIAVTSAAAVAAAAAVACAV